MIKSIRTAAGFVVFSLIGSHAFAFFGSPSVQVQSVTQLEMGAIVPINVVAKNFKSDDPVARISIEIDSNPLEHKKVLQIDFDNNPGDVKIMTRARLSAAESGGKIKATVFSKSGKEFVESFETGPVGNPVDFNNKSTLLFSVRSSSPLFQFNTNKLFESNLYYQQRGDRSQIGGNFQHPSLPSNLGKEEQLLIGMDAIVSAGKIFSVTYGSAITNDPYLQVELDSAFPMSSLMFVVRHSAGSVELKARPR